MPCFGYGCLPRQEAFTSSGREIPGVDRPQIALGCDVQSC